jgi:radical SAM superfamily enzyme YgiQ (UPF0313 family)
MNKVSSRSHFDHYLANTKAIFQEAVKNEIPVMVFMIAGYPGDRKEDLEESLAFARDLSRYSGPGGHVFKIGECHVYPKTGIYSLARSLPDVIFDDDGVFGQNVVRQPSRNLDFDTVVSYSRRIYKLSNRTPKLEKALFQIMPFFRLPEKALRDDMLLDKCFKDSNRNVMNVAGDGLSAFKRSLPNLVRKYQNAMAGHRKNRSLKL